MPSAVDYPRDMIGYGAPSARTRIHGGGDPGSDEPLADSHEIGAE